MNKKTTLPLLYITGFIFALRTAIPTYINSTFLLKFISEKNIGFIYVFGSVITLTLFLFLPKILKKIGNYKLAVFLSTINILGLFGLSFLTNPLFLLISFIISLTSTTIIGFCLDIFVERNTDDRTTGKIRSFFLTSINLAWLFSPSIAGLIVGIADYSKIYLFSTILMLPVIILFITSLRKFQDAEYKSFSILETFKILLIDKNLFSITKLCFILNFFYSWMIIYIPIYLNTYIGFDWKEIGLMFSIMLLPFVFIEIPLGKLADTKFGEKEILSLGVLIIAVSVGIISFIDEKNFMLWALILLMTRIGASMTEIMSETYFFKKINSSDANILSIYRMMSPLAYIFGPIVASMLLYYSLDIKYLFIILGFIVLYGLKYSFRIEDTK
ncbi:MAG: MFS transporter [Minisyncoccia bacterium]